MEKQIIINPFICKICSKYFTNPICFNCGHCVCYKCINHLDPFKCPICNRHIGMSRPIYCLDHKLNNEEFDNYMKQQMKENNVIELNKLNDAISQYKLHIGNTIDEYNEQLESIKVKYNELTQEYESKKKQLYEIIEKQQNKKKQLKIIKNMMNVNIFRYDEKNYMLLSGINYISKTCNDIKLIHLSLNSESTLMTLGDMGCYCKTCKINNTNMNSDKILHEFENRHNPKDDLQNNIILSSNYVMYGGICTSNDHIITINESSKFENKKTIKNFNDIYSNQIKILILSIVNDDELLQYFGLYVSSRVIDGNFIQCIDDFDIFCT